MYIPIWVIVLPLLTAAIAVILWQQGKKRSDWYERTIEVVGKPYVLWVFIGAAMVLGAAYWFYLIDIITSVHHMVGDLRAAAESDVPWAEKTCRKLPTLPKPARFYWRPWLPLPR